MSVRDLSADEIEDYRVQEMEYRYGRLLMDLCIQGDHDCDCGGGEVLAGVCTNPECPTHE